jgi:hypothetical protein
MTPTNQTPPANDPYAGFPSSASIEADGCLLRETDKALQVQLADGRTVWVPKSVGLMARRVEKGREQHPSLRIDPHDLKSVVIVPLWFWRKLPAA